MSEKHKKSADGAEEIKKPVDGGEEESAQTERKEQPKDSSAPAEEKNPLEKKLEAAEALAEDYKRKWYSVSAEYDNYRKRTQVISSQAYQDGKAEAILKLLPVADTFGYAYEGASDEKTKAGIDKIIKNFNNIILSLGVEEIPISVGDEFSETTMEAVMNVPCAEGEAPNVVKTILKKGYRREGKVIRFAQVSVTV